ncbi:unnamed protein product [Symbiodinium sp. CCMP2456]|nr:unnamed protein product [Symbiodinium sp. CCMP2456]
MCQTFRDLATLISCTVAVAAVRPLHDISDQQINSQESAEPTKVLQWAQDPTTRARTACSFWKAQPDESGLNCVCSLPGYSQPFGLSRFCLWSHQHFSYPDEFSPTVIEEHHPTWQLWNEKCECVKYLDEYRDHPVEVQRITAVDFCSMLFVGAFYATPGIPKWERRYLVQKRDAMVQEVDRQLSSNACKRALADRNKMSQLFPGDGALDSSLRQVCQTECVELVDEIRSQSKEIADLGVEGQGSMSGLCSDLVVKKVEANLLGCCGDSCGWNGESCLSWPFLSADTREGWKKECCTERHILQGSERELMCLSILPHAEEEPYVQLDEPPADNGIAAFVGEDEELVWTKAGAHSLLGRPGWAEEGRRVYAGFLRWQPITVQEGLNWGYWTIQKRHSLLQTLPASSSVSLAQMNSSQAKNSEGSKMCTEDMRKWHAEAQAAQDGWMYFPRTTSCLHSSSVNVLTPQDCLASVSFNHYQNILGRYFEFNQDDVKPITCWVETRKYQCSQKILKDLKSDAAKVKFEKIRFYKRV